MYKQINLIRYSLKMFYKTVKKINKNSFLTMIILFGTNG